MAIIHVYELLDLIEVVKTLNCKVAANKNTRIFHSLFITTTQIFIFSDTDRVS